jgi:hypothetical protein
MYLNYSIKDFHHIEKKFYSVKVVKKNESFSDINYEGLQKMRNHFGTILPKQSDFERMIVQDPKLILCFCT